MNLTDPRFQDAESAREWLEMQRWPQGPYRTLRPSLLPSLTYHAAHSECLRPLACGVGRSCASHSNLADVCSWHKADFHCLSSPRPLCVRSGLKGRGSGGGTFASESIMIMWED